MSEPKKTAERRCDFVLVFDVQDGNPNGDPDAGNLPRIDPQTMHGLVSDGCLKRKIRDYVELSKKTGAGVSEPGYEIYVKHRGVLNEQHQRAYDSCGLKVVVEAPEEPAPEATPGPARRKGPAGKGTKAKQPRADVAKARVWMCANFFDIRAFGAVMSTAINCGQVRGPVQLTFARSVDPIVPLEISLTRVAVTKTEDAERKVSEMGHKSIVPYGLYVAHGFVSPAFAADTGFTIDDLDLIWKALVSMFDIDRSAARGLMTTRKLYVFEHSSALGEAPAHRLFDLIKIRRKEGIKAPRSFADYEITRAPAPTGVTVTEKVDGLTTPA